jgi:tetratricopeptide (TPR) repeat protein
MMRIVVIVCVLAATARAEPSPHDEAKAHFKQGKAYQDAGAFLRAADEFKAAYALDPRPEMLFDAAQAYRLGGDKPHAIEFFKSYLAAQPEGKAAEEARLLVAELQRQVDEDEAKANANANANTNTQQPPPHEDRPPPPPPQHVDMVVVRTSPPIRIAGLVTAGVGGLALALGVKYGLDARSASDYISHYTGTWGDNERQRYADGEAANRDMKIAYIVGGGLVATGAVLYWYGSRMQAVPVAGPQTVGVAVAGRF